MRAPATVTCSAATSSLSADASARLGLDGDEPEGERVDEHSADHDGEECAG